MLDVKVSLEALPPLPGMACLPAVMGTGWLVLRCWLRSCCRFPLRTACLRQIYSSAIIGTQSGP